MSGRLTNNVTLPLIKKCLVVSWKKKGQNKNKKKMVICNRCGQLNTIVENLTTDITVLASARSVPTLN